MEDPWNPIDEELKEWAYDSGSFWPTQDFDLAVGQLAFADTILELASDNRCPKQSFFLRCAYLIVGDAVRTGYRTESKEELLKFLEKAMDTGNAYILTFVEQSNDLMLNPSKFDYVQWCDGGLAYAQFNR